MSGREASEFARLLRLFALVIVITAATLVVWVAAGFLVLVFSTNPPPPIPACRSMVASGRAYILAAVSFLIGMVSCRMLIRARELYGKK